MKKIIKCSILTMMAASTFSFMNNQSPLNKLISNKAFSKSVVENFSSEVMTDSMLTQITLLSLNSHDMSPIYMMLPVYIGLAINNSKIDKDKQDKIEKQDGLYTNDDVTDIERQVREQTDVSYKDRIDESLDLLVENGSRFLSPTALTSYSPKFKRVLENIKNGCSASE